jgi:DNA-binding transcriptional MerR regulator
VSEATRYAIGDLADLGGVSRRTVRYYVQEGLLPPPLGMGRGNHYGREHLDRLLRVKAMQEAGRTLDEIRRTLAGRPERQAPAGVTEGAPPLPRTLWRRLAIAPGVELHVSGDVRLPSPARLQELATWCRVHMSSGSSNNDEDSDA